VHLHLPHPSRPQLPLPAVLLTLVYAAALVVALGDPGRHALAGLVVLAGLTVRWAVRSRRPVRTTLSASVPVTAAAVDAVLATEAPAPVTQAATA
jgi:hypothetical protein